MPVLVPHPAGQIAYVDGHMMASWSRVPMHKGKITMLGRIMAGSQAVIAHDEAGQALFVAYYPPDNICPRSLSTTASKLRGNREHPLCHRPGGQCRGHGPCVRPEPGLGLSACSTTTSIRDLESF